MAKNDKTRDAIPEQFANIKAAALFWDSHDLTDYEDQTEEVDVTVHLLRQQYLIAIDPVLVGQIAFEAHRRGLTVETLVNLWLSERVALT